MRYPTGGLTSNTSAAVQRRLEYSGSSLSVGRDALLGRSSLSTAGLNPVSDDARYAFPDRHQIGTL